MIKTLTIDGKQVTFKSTGATALLYKAQFGSDFMKDMLKMAPLLSHVSEEAKEGGDVDFESIPTEALETIDFEVFSNMMWTLAKTADRNIPDPINWLDQFEEFPVFELFEELQDLMLRNFQTSKKKTMAQPDQARH